MNKLNQSKCFSRLAMSSLSRLAPSKKSLLVGHIRPSLILIPVKPYRLCHQLLAPNSGVFSQLPMAVEAQVRTIDKWTMMLTQEVRKTMPCSSVEGMSSHSPPSLTRPLARRAVES